MGGMKKQDLSFALMARQEMRSKKLEGVGHWVTESPKHKVLGPHSENTDSWSVSGEAPVSLEGTKNISEDLCMY